jgi:hypothetical protein
VACRPDGDSIGRVVESSLGTARCSSSPRIKADRGEMRYRDEPKRMTNDESRLRRSALRESLGSPKFDPAISVRRIGIGGDRGVASQPSSPRTRSPSCRASSPSARGSRRRSGVGWRSSVGWQSGGWLAALGLAVLALGFSASVGAQEPIPRDTVQDEATKPAARGDRRRGPNRLDSGDANESVGSRDERGSNSERWKRLGETEKQKIREIAARLAGLPVEQRRELLQRLGELTPEERHQALRRALESRADEPDVRHERALRSRLLDRWWKGRSQEERSKLEAMSKEERTEYLRSLHEAERARILARLPDAIRTRVEALDPRIEARYLRHFLTVEAAARTFTDLAEVDAVRRLGRDRVFGELFPRTPFGRGSEPRRAPGSRVPRVRPDGDPSRRDDARSGAGEPEQGRERPISPDTDPPRPDPGIRPSLDTDRERPERRTASRGSEGERGQGAARGPASRRGPDDGPPRLRGPGERFGSDELPSARPSFFGEATWERWRGLEPYERTPVLRLILGTSPWPPSAMDVDAFIESDRAQREHGADGGERRRRPDDRRGVRRSANAGGPSESRDDGTGSNGRDRSPPDARRPGRSGPSPDSGDRAAVRD